MTEIKIRFGPVFRNKAFPVFIGIQCAGIDIDIRIKFLDGYPQPLAWSSLASDAAIIPFPNDEVTPPVTKMYLAIVGQFSQI